MNKGRVTLTLDSTIKNRRPVKGVLSMNQSRAGTIRETVRVSDGVGVK